MTPVEQSITVAREHLAEARRWCRTKPVAAAAGIESACNVLWAIRSDLETRLVANLHEATIYLLACPTMAEGYLDGALFELGASVDRLRLAREAEGRDADLAEAYGRESP